MTSFVAWALSLLAPPPPVFVAPQTPQGMSWCSGKLCDTYREYDVLPGHPSSYGAIPDFAFCTHCGTWLPDVFPEGETA